MLINYRTKRVVKIIFTKTVTIYLYTLRVLNILLWPNTLGNCFITYLDEKINYRKKQTYVNVTTIFVLFVLLQVQK